MPLPLDLQSIRRHRHRAQADLGGVKNRVADVGGDAHNRRLPRAGGSAAQHKEAVFFWLRSCPCHKIFDFLCGVF